nr:hypothetical protein [Tanacetum cinerariifolium]
VVLEELTKGQKIQRQRVLRLIVVVEVLVAVFMAAPVHDSAVNRAHQEVDGEEQILPPRRSEADVKQHVSGTPAEARIDSATKGFERFPLRNIALKASSQLVAVIHHIVIDVLGLPHHIKRIV